MSTNVVQAIRESIHSDKIVNLGKDDEAEVKDLSEGMVKHEGNKAYYGFDKGSTWVIKIK